MRYHFIGIGGIGISALARLLKSQGNAVSGSDAQLSDLTADLAQNGILIFERHKAKNLAEDTEQVIYTEAIPADNPEMQKARQLNIPCFTYFQALGNFAKDYRVIAIAGAHGKTTTTALIALELIAGGLDPTVIVGTKVREFGNRNMRLGKSQSLVVEACEYRESFLNLTPQILVITNIEAEHLDYYGNEERYIEAFQKLCKRVPKSGYIIVLEGDLKIEKALEGVEAKVVKLRIKNYPRKAGQAELRINCNRLSENAKQSTSSCQIQSGIQSHRYYHFPLYQPSSSIQKIPNGNILDSSLKTGMTFSDSLLQPSNFQLPTLNLQLIAHSSQPKAVHYTLPKLQVPGQHYQIDAGLAFATGLLCGVAPEILTQTLQNFQGTWRRFEYKGEKNGILVIDDYAHHPTEIQATLRGAREKFGKRKIICVFQPHQYSRTKLLFNDFVKSFTDADQVIIPNIYRVRDSESDVQSVSAEELVQAINAFSQNALFGDGFENTLNWLKKKAHSGDVVITMGAGPVNEIGEKFLQP